MGAAASGWLDKKTLIEACRTSPQAFAEVFHKYVSGDPTVHVSGTSLPRLACQDKIIVSVPALVQAVLQAGRGSPGTSDLRRQVVFLADQLGVQRREGIAQALGLSRRSVRHILSGPQRDEDFEVLKAARLLISAPERFGLNR